MLNVNYFLLIKGVCKTIHTVYVRTYIVGAVSFLSCKGSVFCQGHGKGSVRGGGSGESGCVGD